MPVRRFYSPRRVLTLTAIIAVILAAAYYAGQAWSKRDTHASQSSTQKRVPKPMLRPPGLLRAKKLCSNDTPKVECRAALRRAIAAAQWNRAIRRRLEQRLHRSQRPVQHLREWTCIHNREGAWNSNTGNGYQGGLQMDHSFSTTYGPDMWRKYGNGPHTWAPRDQMIVAERAYDAGRGFHPWPNTARACGLL